MVNLKPSQLFTGKAKLITIPVVVIAALALWPFTIGGLLVYAVYRYMPQSRLRNIAVAVIVIPTLFIGGTWTWAFFSKSPTPQVTETVLQQSEETPLAEAEEVATSSPEVEAVVEAVVQPVETTQAVSTEVEQQPAAVEGVLVKRVIDGDTIELETGQKVRYIGIDTPETVHPDKPVQCFGKEASAKNTSLVAGKRVRLEKDVSETDRYGRLLRYVYVGDTFVNDYLVRQGYANSSSYPPDVKYQEQFKQAEQEARVNKRGLWGSACSDGSGSASSGAAIVAPAPDTQPTTPQCDIKGNITGEKIYHVPGCASYDKTVIDTSSGERYFCTEAEAVAAGWRKAKNCP
ncbi:MAG: thermonuclease family protein [bacterium]|nr:thermonuclease family protein [bacterium]